MQLLDVGVDVAVIALWLGHESIRTTDIYQHADLAIKERALARLAPSQRQPAATARRMRCSPSWRRCDYAESLSGPHRPGAAPTLAVPRRFRITAASA